MFPIGEDDGDSVDGGVIDPDDMDVINENVMLEAAQFDAVVAANSSNPNVTSQAEGQVKKSSVSATAAATAALSLSELATAKIVVAVYPFTAIGKKMNWQFD